MKKSYIIEAIIFIIFIGLLLHFGVKAFNHFFDIGKTYQVTFHDIDGIVVGSPVKIMGVDVGNVTKINNKFDEIEVKFIIYDSQVPVPAGTLATIEFSGLAGSRSIELYPPHSEFKGRGFTLEEPIRVGDAIGIMGKLGDAMMKSVAGIFEFAKSRSQSQFSSETGALLNATKTTQYAIVNVSEAIVRTDNKLHSSLTNAIAFGEKTNEFATNFNEKTDFHYINNALKYSKRNAINLKENMKNYDKQIYDIAYGLSKDSAKFNKNYSIDFASINSSMNFLEGSLCQMDKIFCIENINKIKNETEKLKTFSQELDNAL